MKGTAILFQEQNITFIEDVDISVLIEIKEQRGYDHCSCTLQNTDVDFSSVFPVFWHEDQVDWDYGY